RGAARRYGAHVRVLELQRNFGQTAAMQAGIDAARGGVIVTLDGDLQNDPADIPQMVRRLVDEDLDLVSGWRKNRKDKLWSRKIPSRIANRLIAGATGVVLHDYGCFLKVYRASVLKDARLYGEMHRFIPAWLATRTKPSRIKEHVVIHHPRMHGKSKYGITRTFGVLLDLITVFFFMRYAARPGHFFGRIALFFGAVGGGIFGWLFILKLLGEDIGARPLLLAGVLSVVMSVQFLTTGILSELLARTYFQTRAGASYALRNPEDGEVGEGEGWA
ncbi:MAG: glycosyltransferase family 2 protein, partial [Gammaproteobacteria bacterium]|nr:glycosyltransferase family 2 protein [Gammaproteobacteria bacterium]